MISYGFVMPHKTLWSVVVKLNDLSKLVMQMRCLTRPCCYMPREESNSALFCAIKDKNNLDNRLDPNIRFRISRSMVNNLLHLPLKPNNMPGNNILSTAVMHHTRVTIFRAVQYHHHATGCPSSTLRGGQDYGFYGSSTHPPTVFSVVRLLYEKN
jgi:hypothetical protein